MTRAQLFKKFKGLEIEQCSFANLPNARSGRRGQGGVKPTNRRLSAHIAAVRVAESQRWDGVTFLPPTTPLLLEGPRPRGFGFEKGTSLPQECFALGGGSLGDELVDPFSRRR